MIVEEMMTRNVITLQKNDTIAKAIKTLQEHKIRHIPIINDSSQVVGIVSDRDLRDASPSIFHQDVYAEDLQKPLAEIMKKEVITAHPLDFVEEIAAVLYECNINCLPIVKENKLVGIVTEKDILHTLVQLTGAHQPGSQIEVRVADKAGALSSVASIFQESGINILSVLVYPDKDKRNKVLVFRIQTLNPMPIIAELKEKGYTVLWPNLPGMTTI